MYVCLCKTKWMCVYVKQCMRLFKIKCKCVYIKLNECVFM